jgi:hypothetical protein
MTTLTAGEFERQLLDSARMDSVPEDARERVAVRLGLTSAPSLGTDPSEGASAPRAESLVHGTLAKAALMGCVGAIGWMFWDLRQQTPAPATAPATAAAGPAAAAATEAASAPAIQPSAEASALFVYEPAIVPPDATARARPAPRRPLRPMHSAAPAASVSRPANGSDDGLLEEVRRLDRARSDLDAERYSLALAVLDGYDQRFPTGQLALEASVLRASALERTGRLAAAKALARQLLARPESGRYRAELERVLAR